MQWGSAIQLAGVIASIIHASLLASSAFGPKVVPWFTLASTIIAFLCGLSWCIMSWKSNFARKLAAAVFVLALIPTFAVVLKSVGLLSDSVFELASWSAPALAILGPIYLAIVFREYDFRFAVWPLVVLSSIPLITLISQFVTVPHEFRFYPFIVAGTLTLLLGFVGWSSVILKLKNARLSHKNVVMVR